MLKNIEFYWDEQTQTAYYLYENAFTGELTKHSKYQPFPDSRGIWWLAGQDPRAKYFAELQNYFRTQDDRSSV